MRHTATYGVLPLVVFLAALGCSSGTTFDSLRAELEKNKAKWNAAGVKSYSYTLSVGCFCIDINHYDPVRLLVLNGKPVVAVSLRNGKDASKYYTMWNTIDELFNSIGNELDYAEKTLSDKLPFYLNNILELKFDDRYGFPTWYKFDAAQVVDEQIIISVSGFQTADDSKPDCMQPYLYEGIQSAVEKRALDFAQCSVDDDCVLYQVDLSCSKNLDVAVSKAGLEDFIKALPILESSVCNIPCSYGGNGSDAITAGCVDNLCKVTKWGI